MKTLILAAAASTALVATPAAADWAGGRPLGGYRWHPDTAFPSTPPIQRYGKGLKGMQRFGRGLSRDAEFRRGQEQTRAIRPAAANLEDSRARCDRLVKAALDGRDQAEIEQVRERCKPRAYGPYLR